MVSYVFELRHQVELSDRPWDLSGMEINLRAIREEIILKHGDGLQMRSLRNEL